ncbi:hypothetical protein [Nocardia crassostreae]|uniref:hypothetical protein n=1 Tax=Nocardia crassostreae TaxID=53428 RepID=UPI00082DDDD7|nr:hypothetical protein [Nocardia crassostreae]
MKKSVVVVALLALPVLAACSSKESTQPAPLAAPTTSAAVVTSAPVTTTSGAPTTSSTLTTPGGTTTTSGGAVASGGLTTEQISQSLQDKAKLNEQTADCIANIYVAEGISQSGIGKIIDEGYKSGSITINPATLGLSSDDFRKLGKGSSRVVAECG